MVDIKFVKCSQMYTVAKIIGNWSDRWKIPLFITNISATYNCILSYEYEYEYEYE